jgi:hypothetical protein
VKTKLFLFSLIPLCLVLALASLFATAKITVLLMALCASAEVISILVFFSAWLICLAEKDRITVIRANFHAILLSTGMFLMSFGWLFFYPEQGKNMIVLPFTSHHMTTSSLFISLSTIMAAASGLIAIFPINTKWANIPHTTLPLLASVLFFGLFISSMPGLLIIGFAFWVIEVAIFSFAFRRASKTIRERQEINDGKVLGSDAHILKNA